MTTQQKSSQSAALRRTAIAVAGAYGAQGLGYAVVVTAVPSFQARHDLSETAVSIVLLGVCVAAAIGSVIADVLAIWRNSRLGVVVGFLLEAAGLVLAALSPDAVVFIVAIAIYGVGLGVIDAASNMQGVLVQRHWGGSILGRFFAVYTVGAIVGALVMSAGLQWGAGAVSALLAAALLQVIYVMLSARTLDAERAAREAGARRGALPRASIVVVGLVVLAAFTVDSGISTWSSVHLVGIGAALAFAPLGYAVYQGGVLAARLATDPLVRGAGMRRVMLMCVIAGVLGCLVVGFVPLFGFALAGFLFAGLCVGALVPIAFGLAGRIDPARSDEIVARVNLFNYGGALIGAVGIGLLLDIGGSALAFAIPAAALLLVIPALRSKISQRTNTPHT
ncbi:MFS family permease [Microbacterium halimionae]|uniref:MFS family permease n=1 Tax=Microbacterium halimionae TaxID=1526413 RepID=A0A7W3PLT7_9MICO|nr:MFS transporter [Microbacterium halimionae]MBA8816297.1 MFS family permease [Microbacterium halimionae]NII96500.1 MFS family permease [Microbacterium halimionae]